MAQVEVSGRTLIEVTKACQDCQMCPDAKQSEQSSGGRVTVTGLLAGVDVVKNGLTINCPLLNLQTRVIKPPDITEGDCAEQFSVVFNFLNHRRANQRQYGGQRRRGRPRKKFTSLKSD